MTGKNEPSESRTTSGAQALLDQARSGAGLVTPDHTRTARPSLNAYFALAVILVATALAYSPVLFNFFNGDDFVHLSWLKDAVKHPDLIWRNFHSAWLDGTTARFYRPLISVFMVSDYLLWGANGLGFRLTNLTCHVFSTIFLFFIVRRLFLLGNAGPNADQSGGSRWAVVSAALFALYPLHPEPVSWITGRVDSVVTVFYLGSLWFYMQWRQAGRRGWLAAAISFMILGLLSKEMAVTLPVTLLIYEALVGTGNQNRRTGTAEGGTSSLIRFAFNTVVPTLPFWVLLVAYFGVRRLALGTFVGGYDDSLFFVSNWRAFIAGWLHGIRMLLVPINKDFLGAHNILTKTWEVSVILCFAGGIWTVLKQSSTRRPAAFVVLWLLLALVPVYKIFAIGDDLQGSRLAYLATAPLCVLMALALAGSAGRTLRMRPIAVGLSALALVITASAGVLLWTNNQSWAAAGREVNAIRGALNDLYRKIPGDPQVLFIGLPDHIHGAYACRNALWGMTKYPQLHRDIQNCQMVNGYDPIFPFGFLKDSLSGSRDQVLMFRWGGIARGFIPINFGSVEGSASTASAPAPLTTRLEPVPRPGSTYLRRADGTIEVRGGSGFRGRPELNFNLDRTSCWSVDFIAVDIVVPEPATLNPRCGADILYSNELVKDFELSHRSHADILPGLKEQRLIFPFRSSTDWSFGGRCRGLKLLLPDATHLIVKAVSVMPRSEIMPAIDFKNSGYLGTKGYIHLSAHEPFQDLAIDVRSIARARGAILEITRPNLLFESQNSQLASSVVMKSLQLRGRQGTLRLERNIFPAAVMYEIRAWAIDDGGRKIGVAGDHLVVSVDP